MTAADEPRIDFECPACNEVLKVRARYIGQRGQCNKCGATITVTPPQQHSPAKELSTSEEPMPVPGIGSISIIGVATHVRRVVELVAEENRIEYSNRLRKASSFLVAGKRCGESTRQKAKNFGVPIGDAFEFLMAVQHDRCQHPVHSKPRGEAATDNQVSYLHHLGLSASQVAGISKRQAGIWIEALQPAKWQREPPSARQIEHIKELIEEHGLYSIDVRRIRTKAEASALISEIHGDKEDSPDNEPPILEDIEALWSAGVNALALIRTESQRQVDDLCRATFGRCDADIPDFVREVSQRKVNRGLGCIVAVAAMIIGLSGAVGCATPPRDFSGLTDSQLTAEYNKIERKIRVAESQRQALMNQTAQATTPEASMSAGFSAGAVGIQLNRLHANRGAALAEAQRRSAARANTQRATSTRTPAASTEPDGTRIPYKSYPATEEEKRAFVAARSSKSHEMQAPDKRNPGASEMSQKSSIKKESDGAGIRMPVYTGSTSGHWIAGTFSSGHFVVMEDDSVWEVSSLDTFETRLWLTTEEITLIGNVYSGSVYWRMLNTDTGERVAVTYRGQVVLRSHIQEEFEGWKGDTIIVLDNGHVLKQATPAYEYYYAFRPEIIVTEGIRVGQLIVFGVIIDGVEAYVYVRELR